MKKQKFLKKERGITLIALVVTIVVLLILAGISINAVLGDNGLISKAKEAKEKTEQDAINTQIAMDTLYNELVSASNDNPTGGNGDSDDLLNEEDEEELPNEDATAPTVEITNIGITTTSATIDISLSNVTEADYPITINYYKKIDGENDENYECVETKAITEGTTDSYTYSELNLDGTNGNTGYIYILKIEVLDNSENSNSVTTTVQPVCFVAGTKVLTETGLRNIEDIKVGEKVYSKNLETNEIELKEVTEVFERKTNEIYEITIGEELVETTANHRFYVLEKGWVRAYELEEGDSIFSKDNKNSVITNIERKYYEDALPVYNMTVKDNHNYFVTENKLLVHNASDYAGHGSIPV